MTTDAQPNARAGTSTDAGTTTGPPRAPGSPSRILPTLRRLPVTIALVIVLLVVGVASGSLWMPSTDQPWYWSLAYGLPSLEAGAWWSPVTGTVLVAQPWGYLLLAALIPISIGWLEWRRGSRIAAGWFVWGQLVAIAGATLVVLSPRPPGRPGRRSSPPCATSDPPAASSPAWRPSPAASRRRGAAVRSSCSLHSPW